MLCADHVIWQVFLMHSLYVLQNEFMHCINSDLHSTTQVSWLSSARNENVIQSRPTTFGKEVDPVRHIYATCLVGVQRIGRQLGWQSVTMQHSSPVTRFSPVLGVQFSFGSSSIGFVRNATASACRACRSPVDSRRANSTWEGVQSRAAPLDDVNLDSIRPIRFGNDISWNRISGMTTNL